MKRTVTALAVLAAAGLSTLAAQTAVSSLGVIVFAQGEEFSIHRAGESRDYRIDKDEAVGVPLLAGDLVQTERRTFLEIQLYPSRTLLRIAENTTFRISGLTARGGADIELTYGRLRARVDRLAGDPFMIRGRSAVAGVRGTDFGYDRVVGLDAQTRSSIYCLEGEVEVLDTQAGSFVIRADEMIDIRTDPSSARTMVEKLALDPDIVAYWRINDFRTEPFEPSLLVQTYPGLKRYLSAAAEPAVEADAPRAAAAGDERPADGGRVVENAGFDLSEFMARNREPVRLVSGSILGIGAASVLAGVLVANAELVLPDTGLRGDQDTGKLLMVLGGLFGFTGLFGLVLSF